MEADDLDSLIQDSIGGVQSALEVERKPPAAEAAAAPGTGAAEAVRELQQGAAEEVSSEEFFAEMVKRFQDPEFQANLAKVLEGSDLAQDGAEGRELEVDSAAADSAGKDEPQVEEFLQNFMKNFESAVGSDESFADSMTNVMTSMLSSDLICEPLKQLAEHLEPWLARQGSSLPSSDRSRYEAQLGLYKRIIAVYKGNVDPLPEGARAEVQTLLHELHGLGQPPEEVLQEIAPKETEDGGESFEDFVKSMGLHENLGGAELDLLKKLGEDPEELGRVMQEMTKELATAGEKPDEACKQQ